MERPPSIINVEDQEKEVSPEKRSRMWETLRMAALAGLLTFGGLEAGKQAAEYMNQTDQKQEDLIKQTEEQNRQENERLQKANEQSRKERESLTIVGVGEKGIHVDENGKRVEEVEVKTADGKVYETRAETDFESQVGETESIVGGVDWNRALVSQINNDGSGFKINYETTKTGLKMTMQELGPDGQILSERVSFIQDYTQEK